MKTVYYIVIRSSHIHIISYYIVTNDEKYNLNRERGLFPHLKNKKLVKAGIHYCGK